MYFKNTFKLTNYGIRYYTILSVNEQKSCHVTSFIIL